LSAADIAVVSLEVGLDGLAIPSKAFSFLAAGAALLLISREGSELADMVRRHECGWLVEPGDSDQFANRITDACADRDLLRTAQRNSRKVAERLGSRRNTQRIIGLLRNSLLAEPAER
jgi:glycosyltransferase involved in cell wall biosynthesis